MQLFCNLLIAATLTSMVSAADGPRPSQSFTVRVPPQIKVIAQSLADGQMTIQATADVWVSIQASQNNKTSEAPRSTGRLIPAGGETKIALDAGKQRRGQLVVVTFAAI